VEEAVRKGTGGSDNGWMVMLFLGRAPRSLGCGSWMLLPGNLELTGNHLCSLRLFAGDSFWLFAGKLAGGRELKELNNGSSVSLTGFEPVGGVCGSDF
jgi:hypothetical protein